MLGRATSVTILLAAGLAACTTTPMKTTPDRNTGLATIAAEVSESSLLAYVEAMASFGTRHTLSDTQSDTRGIGAARRWVEDEFRAISAKCGGCLSVVTPSAVVTSPPRIPEATEVVNVVAVQRGTGDPDRVIIVQGHLDSRASDIMDATSDAPGANDDASGVAAAIEAARILSTRQFNATLVYAVLTGEEQGLHGARILADYAHAQGWRVMAVLNNDIIGNIEGSDGRIVDDRVRVFSEGVRSAEPDAIGATRRSTGGEVDAPSRQIARYMRDIADRYIDGLEVMMVYRRDRFGRGGDQIPMLEAGFPAVRISEAAENYNRQHQDIRTENGRVYGDTVDGVDFPYLARVTRLNLVTMASMAWAPPPPADVSISGAVSANTSVRWSATPGAAGYRVWWRDTLSPVWTNSRRAAEGETSLTLEGVVIDDWFFGVSSISADGYESPVRFAGVVGDYFTGRD